MRHLLTILGFLLFATASFVGDFGVRYLSLTGSLDSVSPGLLLLPLVITLFLSGVGLFPWCRQSEGKDLTFIVVSLGSLAIIVDLAVLAWRLIITGLASSFEYGSGWLGVFPSLLTSMLLYLGHASAVAFVVWRYLRRVRKQ